MRTVDRRTLLQPMTVLCMAAVFVLPATSAGAGDLKVIVNPGVAIDSVSADDLRNIFLLTKKAFADGTHAEPVLEKSGAAHAFFLKHYLDKSDDTLTAYYRNAVFTGKGLTPRSFGSDAEVAAYVAKTKGAIGYVGSAAATAGVKTIAIK